MLLLLVALVVEGCTYGSPDVVISQFFPDFVNPYVELFNRGHEPIDLSQLSLQTGFWDYSVTTLEGVLNPGQFCLVSFDQSGDIASRALTLSPFQGGLALVMGSKQLPSPWPDRARRVDLVGYGARNPSLAFSGQPLPGVPEGMAMSRPNPCEVTDINARDFVPTAPSPRHRASPLTPCSALPPSLATDAVRSSVTDEIGPISPGEWITLRGENLGPRLPVYTDQTNSEQYAPKQLAGTRVLFDGEPVFLRSVAAGQIEAIVPFTAESKARVEIIVETLHGISNTVSTPVTKVRPRIFTTAAEGRGCAATVSSAGQRIDLEFGSPPGSVVSFFCTGLGALSPAVRDGRIIQRARTRGPHDPEPSRRGDWPRPVSPVEVWIGDTRAEVIDARAEVDCVVGKVRVDVRIPAGLTGPAPLRVVVGGVASQPGVYLPIQRQGGLEDDYRKFDYLARDLVYDPLRHLIYASVTSADPQYPDSVIRLDPVSGRVIGSFAIHTPQRLELSRDCGTLWIYSEVDRVINRIDLRNGAVDFSIALDEIYPGLEAGADVYGMQSVPNRARAIVLVCREPSAPLPLIVIDDREVMPFWGPTVPETAVTFDDHGRMWTSAGLCQVTERGVEYLENLPPGMEGYGEGSFPFLNAGKVMVNRDSELRDSGNVDLLGRLNSILFPAGSAYRADTGFFYFFGSYSGLRNFGSEAYDLDRMIPVGWFQYYQHEVGLDRQFEPKNGGRLISVGPEGLATVSAGSNPIRYAHSLDSFTAGPILIAPLSLFYSLPPARIPAPQPFNGQVRRFDIASQAMTATPAGDRLVLSIPSHVSGIGNSIIDLDPVSGVFGSPKWAGSEPGAGIVSEDGRTLYLLLNGSKKLQTWDLPSLVLKGALRLTDDRGVPRGIFAILTVPNSASLACGTVASWNVRWSLLDGWIERPWTTKTEKPYLQNGWCQFSSTGAQLYCLDSFTSAFGFSRWKVTERGFEFLDDTRDMGNQFDVRLHCQDDVCVTGSGILIDPVSLERHALRERMTQYSQAALDLENHRVFLTDFNEIFCYDIRTLQQTGHFVLPDADSLDTPHTMLKVAGNQLALAAFGKCWLVPIALVVSD